MCCMYAEEDILDLTPEMSEEATDRDDDLGRIVSAAFVFDLPPFPDPATGGRD